VPKSDAPGDDQHVDDSDAAPAAHGNSGNRAERHPDKALERLVDRSPTRVDVETAMRVRDVSR
jgi:hypothetical protein